MTEWKQIGPFWSLSDTFTVHEAAALIAGFDPHAVDASGEFFRNIETGLTDSNGIGHVATVLKVLANAINAGKLKAMIRRDARLQGWDECPSLDEASRSFYPIEPGGIPDGFEQGVIYREAPDWKKTTIDREDLIAWLRSRGHTTGFFFPDAASAAPGYLDRNHPRYAPKLAALVHAWMATEDTKGKTPKQAIERWLRVNAGQFDLTDEDGNPMGKTIGEISSVPNWATKGGAPKTPG